MNKLEINLGADINLKIKRNEEAKLYNKISEIEKDVCYIKEVLKPIDSIIVVDKSKVGGIDDGR